MSSSYLRNTKRSKEQRKVEPTGWPGFSRDWYVHSSKAGTGTTPQSAAATLNEVIVAIDALGDSGDNAGHTIHVLPNHAETVTGAAAIACDVPGLRIIGYGYGNQRPRFLLDAGTSVTVTVSAADVYIENCVFAAGHDGIVTCFDVTAGGFTLKNCEFEDNTTAEHFLVAVLASGAADNMWIEGCRWVSIDAGPTHFVKLSAIGVDRLTLKDNYWCVDASTATEALLDCAATAGSAATVTGCYIANNVMITGHTTAAQLVDVHGTGNTGYIAWNHLGHHEDATVTTVDADGVRMFENKQVSNDAEQGLLDPQVAGDT